MNDQQFPPNKRIISLDDEIDLRIQTRNMYREGGIDNVIDCVTEMGAAMNIVLETLRDIMEEERKKEGK